MKADLATRSDLRVPRYTSYPTAPHFAGTVPCPTSRNVGGSPRRRRTVWSNWDTHASASITSRAPKDDLAVAHAEGRLHRNFQGYTTDTAPVLLGFGASAIGSLPQGYVQNTQSLRAYHDAVTNADFATERGVVLSPDDHLRRDVIERLMCDMAVDLKSVCKAHGVTRKTLGDGMKRLDPLAQDGLVEVDIGRVTVTAEGRPFVRLDAAAFDTYLNNGEMRHSTAV